MHNCNQKKKTKCRIWLFWALPKAGADILPMGINMKGDVLKSRVLFRCVKAAVFGWYGWKGIIWSSNEKRKKSYSCGTESDFWHGCGFQTKSHSGIVEQKPSRTTGGLFYFSQLEPICVFCFMDGLTVLFFSSFSFLLCLMYSWWTSCTHPLIINNTLFLIKKNQRV